MKNSKSQPKLLYSQIRNKQHGNNKITTLTSDTGEDMPAPTEIVDRLDTYFQSVFVRDKNFDRELPHFTQRTGSECNDDQNKIFTLKALYQTIDRLIDYNTIGVDKTIPFILKGCKMTISAPLLIIFGK